MLGLLEALKIMVRLFRQRVAVAGRLGAFVISLSLLWPVVSHSEDLLSEEIIEEAIQTPVIITPPQPAESIVIRHPQTQSLPESLISYLEENNIPPTDISVFVQDVNADAPLLLHEPDTLRNPASTMKLLTTWAALKSLGPAKTWDTEAWLRGELRDGVLHGDLILKGYGDPFLVYESFWQFVHDLRLKGLKEITGDIIIDNSFFTIPEGDPAAFDGEPQRTYNALPSALMFNFQATRVLLEPDAEGTTVKVNVFPKPRGTVTSQLQVSKGACKKRGHTPKVRAQADGSVLISGQYIAACGSQLLTLLLSSPEEHTFNAFRDFWEMLGGQLGGSLVIGAVQAGDKRFHVHTSPPLADQVRLINKWSNNVMTRQLLLAVGAKILGTPATLDKGRLAVLKILHDQGISTQGMVIDNGSGLSRIERVSARQFGQLLQTVWHDPYMPEMLSSLPLLGEDGTLAKRFRRTDLKGRSRLKTGTLRDASSIAGYMLTRSGKRMMVVVQQNGSKASGYGQAVQNRVLEWVFEQ